MTRRIAWLTDVHLNFLRPPEAEEFYENLLELNPDALMITGDIGESHDVAAQLAELDKRLARPIYFVLGNHDFYFGSIVGVRGAMAKLCEMRPNLVYLSQAGVFELSPTTGLVGHDGWADARLGDYERSYVMMNDYKLIKELSGMDKEERWPVLMRLGDEAAEHLRKVLPEALARYEHVFLATHVPPLREACWHQGRLSDDEWAPHFTCKAVGDAILEIMRFHPQRRLTVLCGHTHGAGKCRPLANVEIFTGGAEYCEPDVQRVFEID